MSQVDIHPVKFIKVGTELEVRFIDSENDTYKWYGGIVSNVSSFGNDDNGGFVECDIDYKDGECEKKARLYDKDFHNDNSEDSWKFVGTFSLLISFVLQNTEEVKNLQKELREKDQEVRALISDLCMEEDSYSSDEPEDVCYYQREYHNERRDLSLYKLAFVGLASSFLFFAFMFPTYSIMSISKMKDP